jgi:hypothetical protein
MANKHYQVSRKFFSNYWPAPNGFDKKTLVHDDTSVSSPRVGGVLKLQSNPFEWYHCRMPSFVFDARFKYADRASSAADVLYQNMFDSRMTSLTNKALARFTGKVRKHNASLGVTLGSIGQSRDMIVDRTYKIADILHRVELSHELQRRKLSDKQKAHQRRTALKDRAGDFLEWEFGWMPLVSDIQAALGALSRAFDNGWIDARATLVDQVSYQQFLNEYTLIRNDRINLSVCIGANVSIANPNLFLANRLGLLNLPGVAWDLIPWSFVVNMFTNMGQIVNSMSDFVGVNVVNASTTRSAFTTREDMLFAGSKPFQEKTTGYAESSVWEKRKLRTVGGLPSPSFEMKLPELNLELALIGISLVLQKLQRINKLFGNNALNFSFPSIG